MLEKKGRKASGRVDSMGKGTGAAQTAGKLDSVPRSAEYFPWMKHCHRLVIAFNLVTHTLRLVLLFPFYRWVY